MNLETVKSVEDKILDMIVHGLTTQFALPPSYVADYLDRYYILHWSGSFLVKKLLEIEHTRAIKHQGIDYHFLSKQLPARIDSNKLYKLSFRKLKSSLSGVVLIKEILEPRERKEPEPQEPQ